MADHLDDYNQFSNDYDKTEIDEKEALREYSGIYNGQTTADMKEELQKFIKTVTLIVFVKMVQ